MTFLSLPQALCFACSVTLTGITPLAQEKHWADSSRIKCLCSWFIVSSQSRVHGFLFPGKNSDCQGIIPRKFMLELLIHSKSFLLIFWSKPHVLQMFHLLWEVSLHPVLSWPCRARGALPELSLATVLLQWWALTLHSPTQRRGQPADPLFLALSVLTLWNYLFHTAKDMFPLSQTNFSMKKSEEISALL